jgi:CrcB protein
MNDLLKWALVGAGGGLGAMARYGLSGVAHGLGGDRALPLGTLTVNVLGCFAIGALAYLAGSRGVLGAEWRLLLITGFLGGFTTFSTFGNETLNLILSGDFWPAFGNMSLHVALGLAAVWAGRALAVWVWR